jgi:hypothetical protein
MSMEELVIRIPPQNKPGYACPQCGGSGKNADGSFSMGLLPDGTTEYRSRPCSDCCLCNGKGRVLITPIPD